MFRKILAGLLALAGIAAVTVGILSATVYRPSDTVTATMDAPTTPVVLIPPGMFGLVSDQVTMTVTAGEASDPIAIVSSPTYDVVAWVGPAATTTITGLADWETLAVEVAEGESTVPDPAGADLWRTETLAEGEFSAIITADRDPVTVLIATDGTKPAPSVSLSWPVEVTTPYLVPLLVAGGVLLLAALALAFLGRKAAPAAARERTVASAAASPAAPVPVTPGRLTRRQLRELERQKQEENTRLGADGPIVSTAGAVGAAIVPAVVDPERFRALRHVIAREETELQEPAAEVPSNEAGPAAGAGIVPGVADPSAFRYAEAKDAGPAAGAAIVPGAPHADRFRTPAAPEAPARTSWRDLWGMKNSEEQR